MTSFSPAVFFFFSCGSWPIIWYGFFQVQVQDVDQMLLQEALSTPVVAVASPSSIQCVIGFILSYFMWYLITFLSYMEWFDMDLTFFHLSLVVFFPAIEDTLD